LSPRFGAIEVSDDKRIDFPRGLPGFPDCRGFVVMEHDRDTPLRWLQCIDRPEVSFLVVDPAEVMTSYAVDIPPHVLETVEFHAQSDDPSDVAVLIILNAGPEKLTANLRAPVVVNARSRRALQMIIDDPHLPLRHPV
jgi:flagellar assembly factor FliW